MPNICKKCSKKTPSSARINGKRVRLTSRKYCLDCSQFGLRNTRKLESERFPEKNYVLSDTFYYFRV